MKTRISVIGASGYTGVELVRLLLNHPSVRLAYLVSYNNHDRTLNTIYPHLSPHPSLRLTHSSLEQVAESSDIVFLALPHTQSLAWVPKLLKYGCKVIDLSADFRLKSAQDYQKYYQATPAKQSLLNQAIYGLPEVSGVAAIAAAKLVANPGCYATAALLGAAPVFINQWLESNQTLIIDAKSGVSGAGRSLSLNTHFCEVADNLSVYAVGQHRHIPEILQQLKCLQPTVSAPIKLQFTPHLLAIPRGLMATLYLPLNADYSINELLEGYQNYYDASPFIQIWQQRARIGLKNILGSNYCSIDLHWDSTQRYLTVICCIDNLLKGAAGQAVQNMNILLQLPQNTGLQHCPIYP